MTRAEYRFPCKTKEIRDDFADHVARGSVLPGVDFACNTGDDVWAAADGVVALADNNANQVRGKNVIVRHKDGHETHYLHLSKVVVRNGQRVKSGQLLGEAGNTGTTSTGAHLHFARKDRAGRVMNPIPEIRKDIKAKREAKKLAETVEALPAPVEAAE